MKSSRAAGLSSLSIVLHFGGGTSLRFPAGGRWRERRLGFPCSRSEKSSAFKQHDAHYLEEQREQMTEQTRQAVLSCSTTAPAKCVDLMAFAGNRRKLLSNFGI